jgi:hypothetical protein
VQTRCPSAGLHPQTLLSASGSDAGGCKPETPPDETLVAAAGDRELLTAWHALGVNTYDTNAA